MSTGGFEQPDVSPCTLKTYMLLMTLSINLPFSAVCGSQNPVPIDQGACAKVFPLNAVSPPFSQRDSPWRITQLCILNPNDFGVISISPYQHFLVGARTWKANFKNMIFLFIKSPFTVTLSCLVQGQAVT